MKQCSNVTPKRNQIFLTGRAMNRGFTIIELLVVISIIVILTGVVLVGYRTGERQLALQRAANKLAQDIRRVQEMAMSAKEFGGIVPEGGYGIRFKQEESGHYIIFVDSNNNQDYDPGVDGIVEDVKLEKGVEISNISNSPLRITFTPPDPTTTIKPGIPAWIQLGIGGQFKTINVNEVGMISIVNI